MRHYWHYIALVIAVLVGCGQQNHHEVPTPAKCRTPSIVLDDTHNKASSDTATEYSIDPSDQLMVEAGSYKIPVPKQFMVNGPNALHLISGPDEYFRIKWNGSGGVLLSPATLETVKGGGRFTGFKSGKQYMIGIGVDDFVQSGDELNFSVMWFGTVDVR